MKPTKKFFAALLILTIVLTLFVPEIAFAQTGTLGEETPRLTCRFTDSNNEEADGDALSAGDYTVDIVLEGMETLSVFQFTAEYDYLPENLTALEVASVYEGTENEVSCGGIKQEDGYIVVALASENDDCSAIDSEGTVIATLNITVASDANIDFQDLFRFDRDPDLTFAEADYGDGINDAYVLNTEAETSYSKYEMTADESPSLSGLINVEGRVMIANDVNGNPSSSGVAGITVSATVGGETIEAVTDENGAYVLRGLPLGTYTVSIFGETTIDRSVTLPVTSERVNGGAISANNVGIIICDYNKDLSVDGIDKASFNTYYSKSYSIDAYYRDFNNDSAVDGIDKATFNTFYNKTCSYDDVTI